MLIRNWFLSRNEDGLAVPHIDARDETPEPRGKSLSAGPALTTPAAAARTGRMDDLPNTSDKRAEARAAEAAAIRRRWISLGELLAVLAVLISGLTLWLNWRERSETAAEKVQQSKAEQTRAATLTIKAQPASGGDRLDLSAAAADQVIQEQSIRFPASLNADRVETTGKARIEARWFEGALKRAREKAGLPDNSRGDERLPVAIETRFVVDGETHVDIALYDIGYTIRGALLGGHEVDLRGLSLVQRAAGEKAAASALEARWQALMPSKAR